MLRIRPIPRNLLIHEAIYEQFEENGRYGETYLPAVTLKNIRINFEKSFNRSTDTESKNVKALMFFDRRNSSATGEFEFKEKSKVIFQGVTMQVQRVNPLFTDTLHHYEVELI
ncbi:putative minor capsid protein [Cytobacillus oceanisediminis]|uniref:putative minor capsid protein n=1 Tax=Cytobacillus oceanisediminis TaxID=665099 RepID=UPI001C21A691|nr:putative minor capsid protein [Cytobacillus oceanisediminis]MBU8768700.1 minor capsid protein [Cytobacillus oceanisediminis]